MPPLQVTPDSFGFLPLAECKRTALRCTEPDFAQLFPAPGLLVTSDGPGAAGQESPDDRERSFKRTVQDEGGAGMARYRGKIGFVAKRPGNPFPTMISIGRALNSDVVLALDSVSKIHGYFSPGEPGEWWLTDLRSTNGITINGTDGTLARLLPSRIDWSSLRHLGTKDPVVTGDEVLVVALGGATRRGRLASPLDDRVTISAGPGKVYSLPKDEVEQKRFRLMFAAPNLCPGDEFLVTSKSGREYRGLAREVSPLKIVAELRPQRQSVVLRPDRLDLSTLKVLIPVFGYSQTWA